MPNAVLERYSLVGPAGRAAEERGLVGAEWFRSDVPRRRLKELMRREDGPAIRDTLLWVGLLALSGWLGFLWWGTWAAAPAFLVYGILYGSAGDSRWHECGHGTPFRTPALNTVVYHLASFMMLRDPTVWRWSHTRHHTDTLIVGRDPEITVMRPARLARILLDFFGLVAVPTALWQMLLHASGRLTREEATFVPDSERWKVTWTARAWVVLYGATVAAVVVTGSILPAMYVGLPRMYGAFLGVTFALTQHAGMGENVLDHRLNSRTVTMSRVNRFIYWNMGYHVEHHMYPMVPYHRLPDLHEAVKGDLPVPYHGLWAAYKEIVPAVLRQLKDQTYAVRRELPPGATPYMTCPLEERGAGDVGEGGAG